MKPVLTYWVIGCLILGAGTGLHVRRCPNTKVPAHEMLAGIAAWPAWLLVAMIIADRSPPSECKR